MWKLSYIFCLKCIVIHEWDFSYQLYNLGWKKSFVERISSSLQIPCKILLYHSTYVLIKVWYLRDNEDKHKEWRCNNFCKMLRLVYLWGHKHVKYLHFLSRPSTYLPTSLLNPQNLECFKNLMVSLKLVNQFLITSPKVLILS